MDATHIPVRYFAQSFCTSWNCAGVLLNENYSFRNNVFQKFTIRAVQKVQSLNYDITNGALNNSLQERLLRNNTAARGTNAFYYDYYYVNTIHIVANVETAHASRIL